MSRLKIPIEEATPQQLIDFYQRYIIVHSRLYYDMDMNLITDHDYDEKSRSLVSLKEKHPEEWKNSMYYEQFGDDYHGETGMGLYDDCSEKQKRYIDCIIGCLIRANKPGEQKIVKIPKNLSKEARDYIEELYDNVKLMEVENGD